MTAADRARRFATWAAAVTRPPTATPPTVPWAPGGPRPGQGAPTGPAYGPAHGPGATGPGATRPGAIGPGSAAPGSSGPGAVGPGAGAVGGPGVGAPGPTSPGAGGTGLRELTGSARRWATERAAELKVALGPDPARLHARRLERAHRSTRAQSYAAGGVGLATAAAVPLAGLGPVVYAGGGLTAVVAGGAALAGMELRRLRRMPPPPPKPARPPRDSPARGPLDRLAERERALHDLLAHLGDAADEPRRVATAAAQRLRGLGARLTAVHQAHRTAGGLDEAVDALRARLVAGVEAYAALVVAAADAVAADAGLHPPVELQEATDALAGLAAGLRDVAA
jgi:hypothetical protein